MLIGAIVVTALVVIAAFNFVRTHLPGPPPPKFAVAAPPESASPLPSSASVRLMGGLGPQFAGEMVAAGAGLFKGNGVQISLQPGASSDEAIAAVVSGANAVGVARADSFLIARSKGAPIVAFAAGFIESPVNFYLLKTAAFHGVQDFVNLRIGVRDGDDSKVSFDALVAALGLPLSRLQEIPVGADLSMLTDGRVDVWPGHVANDDLALRQSGVDYQSVNPGSYGVHLPGTVYFATEQTIRQHPQLIQGFLNGVVAGWQLAYNDPTVAAPIIAADDEDKSSVDSIRFALDRQRDYVRPLATRFGEFDESHWRSLQSILLDQRLLAGAVDLSTAVTYKFLSEAYRTPLTLAK